jgi:hypothetical protein
MVPTRIIALKLVNWYGIPHLKSQYSQFNLARERRGFINEQVIPNEFLVLVGDLDNSRGHLQP